MSVSALPRKNRTNEIWVETEQKYLKNIYNICLLYTSDAADE